MRLALITVTLLLGVVSCGPSEGDIYENVLEEERFKILKVGQGSTLVEHYKGINDAVTDSMDISKRELNEMELYRPVIFVDSDTSETCFAYEDTYRGMTIINIDPISDLDSQEYQKVN